MKEIKVSAEFTTDPKADDALAIATYGEQGSGKTRFSMTAPDPIGFIPLDRKARKTVERISAELNKRVVMPKADFIRSENPMKLAMLKPWCDNAALIVQWEQPLPPYCCARHYYRWHVNRVKAAAFKLYAHKDIRTIVIDTGTQLWEDILHAHFGRSDRIMPRDRGPANQEMIELLNNLAGKNLIITHKAREIWKNDKPTGRYEYAGFGHLGYHVNTIIHMVNDETKSADDSDRFLLNVMLCQDNPAIQGPGGKALLTDDMITFQNLAFMIFPDDEPSKWE